jgi:hypothetical protein
LAVTLALHESNSVICRNINFICEKYSLDKWHLEQASLNNCIYADESDDAKACRIREFLSFRNSVPFNSEDYVDLSTIIVSDLCEQ